MVFLRCERGLVVFIILLEAPLKSLSGDEQRLLLHVDVRAEVGSSLAPECLSDREGFGLRDGSLVAGDGMFDSWGKLPLVLVWPDLASAVNVLLHRLSSEGKHSMLLRVDQYDPNANAFRLVGARCDGFYVVADHFLALFLGDRGQDLGRHGNGCDFSVAIVAFIVKPRVANLKVKSVKGKVGVVLRIWSGHGWRGAIVFFTKRSIQQNPKIQYSTVCLSKNILHEKGGKKRAEEWCWPV